MRETEGDGDTITILFGGSQRCAFPDTNNSLLSTSGLVSTSACASCTSTDSSWLSVLLPRSKHPDRKLFILNQVLPRDLSECDAVELTHISLQLKTSSIKRNQPYCKRISVAAFSLEETAKAGHKLRRKNVWAYLNSGPIELNNFNPSTSDVQLLEVSPALKLSQHEFIGIIASDGLPLCLNSEKVPANIPSLGSRGGMRGFWTYPGDPSSIVFDFTGLSIHNPRNEVLCFNGKVIARKKKEVNSAGPKSASVVKIENPALNDHSIDGTRMAESDIGIKDPAESFDVE